jgi:hypothetical protein
VENDTQGDGGWTRHHQDGLQDMTHGIVIPAQAGIQPNNHPARRTKSVYRYAALASLNQLDSRLRGNDGAV